MESETQFPLPGATIVFLGDSTQVVGTVSDGDGNFRLDQIPVGRQAFRISFVGYKDVVLNNIIVTSAKEVVLRIPMEESALGLQEVSITATREGDVNNEMSVASSRSFTVEETERYAGSRGDVARMASNFAGVQGADDSRNDIVIRGNSPQAVLWRLEGINIPNPNHFNIPGTAGGPVSMINNKILSNSDFFTGAFPAEYGNSVAGVFDLKLRAGNESKNEFSGQFGFLGTELFGEGPLSRKHSASYLVSYRYSTLSIFNKLGIDIGTDAVPQYQDLAYNVNFPLKHNGRLSFFGLGGKSKVDILVSQQKEPTRDIYGQNDRDQYFRSDMGLTGVSLKLPMSKTGFFSASVAYSREQVYAYHELVFRHIGSDGFFALDSLQPLLRYTFTQPKLSANVFLARKAGANGYLNAGLNADEYFFDYIDSLRNTDTASVDYYKWRTRWDAKDHSLLLQPFVQWKYTKGKTEFIAGLHSQYFELSRSFSPAEPRLAVRYELSDRSRLSAGVGLHSQIQPPYLYFGGKANDAQGHPVPINKTMDFTRSWETVAAYEHFFGSSLRFKSEVYYQYLYNVPVEKHASAFSLLNTGAGFSRFFPDTLVNTGIGDNYGVEFTLERFFTRNYLFLLTTSLFESKYQGSDGVWRDTDFNGNYIFNALFTKEWSPHKKNAISLGGKVTAAGGRRYGPVDEAASDREKDVIFVDNLVNTKQFDPYFRADVRLVYKINSRHVTHELALDLVNVFNTKNVLKLTYAPDATNPNVNSVRIENQLGFLPIFYYRIDF